MKVLKSLFIFALGAAAGGAATFYYAKDLFEKQNKEEQESLLEHYGISRTVENEVRAKCETNLNKPDISEYKRVVSTTNYNSISKPIVKDEVPKVSKMKKSRNIELISFDDLDTCEDYECQTIELYSDGVLASEDDNEVIDSDKYFGDLDLESILDESEYGDCVYVRNHELKLDIEVCKNTDSYADTIASIYSED